MRPVPHVADQAVGRPPVQPPVQPSVHPTGAVEPAPQGSAIGTQPQENEPPRTYHVTCGR